MKPHNDIDTETLQAQIDLAMAHAQYLIEFWLPESGGSLTQSSPSRADESEAELQVLLRRPPRYVASSLFYSAAREMSLLSHSYHQAGRWCATPANAYPRAGTSRAEATGQ